MPNDIPMHVIAHIETAFRDKFGIPRQSGLVPSLRGTIVFAPEYRNPDALRGLEGYSHLWLIWQFSESFRSGTGENAGWSPTVRPPRLGGNTRMGVFATRSPNRPNAIGLSSVEIESIELHSARGPLIHVRSADLMNGTPIFDIKPYLPFTDSHPDARGGFADERRAYALTLSDPDDRLSALPPEDRCAAAEILCGDPRPSYQSDPAREYGMIFGAHEIRFTVDNEKGSVTVTAVVRAPAQKPDSHS